MLRSAFCALALLAAAPAFAAEPAADSVVIQIEAPETKSTPRANPVETYPGLFGADFEEEEAAPGRCVRNPDRKPHGVVEAAVGTGGYRSGAAVVTMPVGDCGQATIAIESSRGGYGGYGRGPRRGR